MAFDYKIIKHIATLSESQNESKQVNVISYNNAKPKIDIRTWYNGEMRKGITLDEEEWRKLGLCFDNACSKEDWKKDLAIFAIWVKSDKLDDIDLGSEGKLDFKVCTDGSGIVYHVTLELDKKKAEKHIDFLNNANKYFAEKGMCANAYIDFIDEKEILKITGKVHFNFGRREELLNALYDFLIDYKDDIVEITVEKPKLLDFKDVIVISDRHACVHSSHKKEEIFVAVDFRHRDGNVYRIEAKACYCQECNLYFMRKHDYQMMKIKSHNAIMLCQEETEEKYLKNPNFEYELNDESILHKFGYNVSDGMSDRERQAILAMFIDRKILSKENIAWRLSGYVKKRMYDRDKFQSAIDKWNRDRDFVLDYDVSNRKKVEPEKITVIKYKTV